MEAILLESSAHSPKVIMDPEKGYVCFEGNLVVPDAVSFFKPLIGWVLTYMETGKDLHMEIKLDYFNTSASKMINTMLSQIKGNMKPEANVTVDWHYQLTDEDMFDMAQEAAEISELEINLISHS